MTPALIVALAAAGATPSVEVTIPNPAQALPRLEPVLGWIGAVAPRLRPRRVRRMLAPLAVSPFEPKSWAARGWRADAPATVVVDASGRLRLSVGIREGAWAAHRDRTPKVTTATASPHRGFVGGRPGLPAVVGLTDGSRLWLTGHRSLFPERPNRRADQAAKLVARLHERVARERGARAPRWRPRLPTDRAPDAVATGRGPDPVARWQGALWADSDRLRGQVNLQLSDGAKLFVPDWISARSGQRWLPTAEPWVVVEVAGRVVPDGLLDRVPELDAATRRGLAGAHVVLTDAGSLVIAAGLNPVAKRPAVQRALARLRAAHPGADVTLRASPKRVVVAFFGRDEARVRAWLERRPKGALSAPAVVRIDPPRLFAAIRARDAADAGPALGAGRVTLARLAYGHFAQQTGAIFVRLWKARRGIDLAVEIDR